MKYLIFIALVLPSLAKAHCPMPIDLESGSYCADILWDTGEKKLKGEFKPVKTLSPYLVPPGTIPQRWIYSRATIQIWQKGDASHTPVMIPDFRIFPWMHMASGHNHSAGYNFFEDTDTQSYRLQELAFQQMVGCWTLRWTTAGKDEEESSQMLTTVLDYTNLKPAENTEQEVLCDDLAGSPGHGGGHHEH